MVIWQLIDSSGVGGAERHVATLSAGLTESGHKVEIFLLDDHGANPWFRQLDAADLAYHVLDGQFGTLLKRLRQSRPGLLHTHGYKAGILGRIAARMARVPVVTTFHSGERGPMPVGLYDFVDEWSSFLAQRIAVSPAIQARLPFTSTVIPSYVETPDQPMTTPLSRHIAFVGRLSEEKGADRFCALARAVPSAGEWHVYGDGPMRARLEAEFGDVAVFHGVETDMGRVWPSVGLLVMPSRFEGVPLVALEAAAAGVPVLAAAVGGLPTVVAHGETGWLYPPGDQSAAIAALDMWSDIVASRDVVIRRACWERARECYSRSRWLPEVLKVYGRATGSSLER